MRIFTGRRLNIETLVFSPDGRFIACNGPTPSPQKWVANVWEVSGDGKPKETFGDRVGGISFTPDSRHLRLFSSGMWGLFDLEKGVLSPDIALGKLVADEVTDDGRWAISSSVPPEGGMLQLRLAGAKGTRWKDAWKRDLKFRGEGVGVLEAWESFSSLRFAANGTRILLGFMFYFREDEPAQPVHRVLDTATGEQVFEWRGYRPSDASPLLIGSQERMVYLFREELHVIDPFAPDSARLIRHSTSRRHFTAAAFSPNGKLLATTSNDTTVTMWDTATWQPIRQYGWEIGKLRGVAFAPDGLTCAAGSDTGKVVLFDVDG